LKSLPPIGVATALIRRSRAGSGVFRTIRRWSIAGVWVLVFHLFCGTAGGAAPDVGIQFLERRVKSDPDDYVAWNYLSSRCLERARVTGDDAWIARATQAAEASLRALGDTQNLGGLSNLARADLAAHRFADALAAGQRMDKIQPGALGQMPIIADALLNLGDLDAAERVINTLAQQNEALETEPRLAQLAIARGHIDDARKHLAATRDLALRMSFPSPLTVAWCQVQLGELAFRTGDWGTAEADYQAALEALPGWWSALEHLAELRGAQGRSAEAFKIYEQVIAAAPRPELLQAVGDLYLFLGQKEAAKAWHDRALTAYREATDHGSVAYYHHMAGFFSDSEPDPVEAVKAARKDLELRHSAPALDALAWALYKSGDIPSAAATMGKALATGIKDSHILYHAGLIAMSAGDLAGGQADLREAAAINPGFQAFHVHR
jgi:tetratricopeptide (TPR) repeat protein